MEEQKPSNVTIFLISCNFYLKIVNLKWVEEVNE